MRLKSYHTATVEAAIRLAHIELGDEAVFLGSRRNDVGNDPGQAYEVTFAVMEGEERTAPSAGNGRPGSAVAPAANGAPTANGVQAASGAQGLAVPAGRENGRTEAPPRARTAAAADEGAFVSWKKLLRHVSSRDVPEASEETDHTPNSNGAVRSPRVPAALSSKTGSGAGNGAAMRHWRDFVPGEMREHDNAAQPGNAVEQALLDDASRVLAAGGQARAAAAPAAAPSIPVAVVPAPPAPAPRRNGVAPLSGRTQTFETSAPAAQRAPLFDTDEPVSTAAPAANKKARSAPPPAEPPHTQVYSLEKLGSELEELRRMFERQQAGRGPLVLPSRALLDDARLAAIYRGLSDNAIEPSLGAEIVAQLQPAAEQGADRKRLLAILAREIRSRFKTDSELGRGGPLAVAAVVGPSGAGKTTVVAKLAFRCGLLRRRRVRLLSVDQLRIGAVEPLQAYAELMNAPLEIIDDFERFAKALGSLAAGQQSDRELVLIDTPGYGRREWERARRLAAAFGEHGGVDVHLVLDLRTKNDDLRRAVEQYQVFSPAKLLFTRLDETATFGTMLNETVRTGLPLSFVSVGQRVPEDIVPAGEPELLRLLLKDRSAS